MNFLQNTLLSMLMLCTVLPERVAAGGANGEPALGTPLFEPDRYYGVYATEAEPNRSWFVAAAKRPPYAEQAPEVPPGYLSLGAMFGDVAPWHLKTLSATEFVQAYPGPGQAQPVAIRFELDAEGRTTAFTFTGGAHVPSGRFLRIGDLPDGWE